MLVERISFVANINASRTEDTEVYIPGVNEITRLHGRINDCPPSYEHTKKITVEIQNHTERDDFYSAFHKEKKVVGSFTRYPQDSYDDAKYGVLIPTTRTNYFDIVNDIITKCGDRKSDLKISFTIFDREEVEYKTGKTEYRLIPILKGEIFGVESFSVIKNIEL